MAEKKDEINKMVAERDEYLAGWKRAKADLVNYKKEEGERMSSARRFACENLISEMLVVLDSFEFALDSSQDNETKKGVSMIKSQLEETLKRSGLDKIDSKVGDVFDESVHEGVRGEGTKISMIVATGYRLNGKVIRPTKVELEN